MITIGDPYIEKNDTEVKVISDIVINSQQYKLYYAFEEKYSEYIVTEKVDGFLIALLPLAIQNNWDIKFSTPISEKMYFQLTRLFLPAIAKYGYFKNSNIKFIGPTSDLKLQSEKAVGTGFSSGVDSFYTLLSNKDTSLPNYDINFLTFFNVGSNGDYGGAEALKLYKQRLRRAINFCDDNNFPLVAVDSNISEILNMKFVETHTFRSMSVVLLLQKLFANYYYSSGINIDHFDITYYDTAGYDLLTLMAISTENTMFYSYDGVAKRIEKIDYISNFELPKKYLNVCQVSDDNCGVCEKCRRTQLALYVTNNLEDYSEVFDVIKFTSNIKKHMGFLMFMKSNQDYKEIINLMKNKNIEIPIQSWLHYYLYQMKHLFRNNDMMKRIYKKYIKSNS